MGGFPQRFGRGGVAEVDVVVIGAGVVGLAAAHEIARAGRSVVVLERAETAGAGISGRNSGVIHAGLHGDPQWRKVRLAVRGNPMLYEWCAQRGVPHARTGKLLVARGPSASAALEAIAARGQEHGVTGLSFLSAERAHAIEPDLRVEMGDAVLMSTSTGVVSLAGLLQSLQHAVRRLGGVIELCAAVDAIEVSEGGAWVDATRGVASASASRSNSRQRWRAQAVINAAGLAGDAIARACGLDVTHIPCRGDYFRLRTRARFARPIYPVPDPKEGGLGIHLTLGLDGILRLGPDADWDCGRSDHAPRPEKAAIFASSVSSWLYPIQASELEWDGCGIRPKLSRRGAPAQDFRLEVTSRRVLHLLGIESPGLTASLALAQEIAEFVRERCEGVGGPAGLR